MQQLLQKLGWKKKDFAAHVGVSPETVSRWGDDPPTIYRLYLESVQSHWDSVNDMEREIKRIKSIIGTP